MSSQLARILGFLLALALPAAIAAQNRCGREEHHGEVRHFWTGPQDGYYF